MKVYNTLTRKKETFEPLIPGKVSMYVCGPTVYNYIHIGNARPYVIFDTVRRYLEYKGYDVTYIQNFTDVDDKIINRANEEGKSMGEIADQYIQEAFRDADGLNIRRADHHPRVTEEMDGIIEMIQTLIDKGNAYVQDGSVYFSTRSDENYGKLSKKNIDDLEAGARVDVDTLKKDPMDFILWKPHKEGEPKWEAPWGAGRPGWHIECSVMAKKYLGESIDIHAGGEDLIFPHHENEIAQSECANGKPFAKYWLHNGFINVNNEKMSKSKGNFFTLREIAAEFPYEVIRFFILSGHYRSPINFSRELLQSTQNSLDRIKNCLVNLDDFMKNNEVSDLTADEQNKLEEIRQFRLDFERAMDDDFNTADAVSAVFELVRFANINVTEQSSKVFAEECKNEVLSLCSLLGMLEKQELQLEIDAAEIETLIEKRTEAKKNKDYAAADQIRDMLKEKGVILEDTSRGVRWSIKK